MKTTITKLRAAVFILAGTAFIQPISAQDTTKFVPGGGIWGVTFGDYAYKTHNDSLQRGGGNVQYRGYNPLNTNNTTNAQSNGFQVRRIYLGYDYQVAPNLSTVLVLANEQNYDASGKNTVYVKYANVKWSNIFKGSDLVIGQYQTASFSSAFQTSPLWGYRAVERTLLDQHAIDNSTDLGASLQGHIYDLQGAENPAKPNFIGYALQVGNNNGAVPNASNYKKGRLNVYGTFLSQKLTVGLYGDYAISQQAPVQTANTTLKAYASYGTEWYRIGVEAFEQINEHSDIYIKDSAGVYTYIKKTNIPSTSTVTKNGVQAGFSVYASAQIVKNKLSAFARYDIYTPDLNFQKNAYYTQVANNIKGSNLSTATFYQQNFVTAGIDYAVTPVFHIIPNIWYNGYSTSPYNGATEVLTLTKSGVETTDHAASSAIQNNYDFVWRVTFSYVFNSTKNINRNSIN